MELFRRGPYAQEDIVQETLLRLLRNVERLRTLESAALVSYMALTVRSAALNYLRAEHRDKQEELPLLCDGGMQWEHEEPVQLTLEEQMLLGHRDELVRNAISRLSERDQLVLLGKYFWGLDNQELMELAGTTPGGLRVQLHRARQRAMKELTKEGVLDG